jgi:hypothetical protein
MQPYTDHVSIVKFIERNWRLSPLSSRPAGGERTRTPLARGSNRAR